jgi:hypothetical protein
VVTPNASPYLLGQIGLVGNVAKSSPFSPVYFERKPYLLGQIGLVGNLKTIIPSFAWSSSNPSPYLLGQIGLVGNTC